MASMQAIREICQVTSRCRGIDPITVGSDDLSIIKLPGHWPTTIKTDELPTHDKSALIDVLERKLTQAGLQWSMA